MASDRGVPELISVWSHDGTWAISTENPEPPPEDLSHAKSNVSITGSDRPGTGHEILGFALLDPDHLGDRHTRDAAALGALPQVLGLGRDLGGTEIAAKEMESRQRAKQVMSAKYVGAHRYQWSSQLVDWAGFGLTSAITFIAGALGRALRTGEDPASAVREALEAQTATSTRRWANIVGAIAATASIMIGLSSRLQSESQPQLGQAENLRN